MATAGPQAQERVVIECPGCRTQFRIDPKALGRQAGCTRCGQKFIAQAGGAHAQAGQVSQATQPTQPVQAFPAHGVGNVTALTEAGKRMPGVGGSSADATRAAKAAMGEAGVVGAEARLGTKLGNFKIVGVLGRGGMGAVYEAEDEALGRRVAVKLLPVGMAGEHEAVNRFLREARSAARLEHPNIVSVYQVGRDGETHYIAMQLVRGGSAYDFLKQNGPMTPRDAARVVLEAAKALAAAHSNGIVHRDIKPANIMLGPSWSVKVADFGLAKIDGSELTTPGGVMGTPSYMSPEACRGEPLDHRADIYSLGATFYCLLVGRPPFTGESGPSIMYKHVYEAPPDPRFERPGIPEGCVHVLTRSLEKDLNLRYQRAEEMIADLEAIDFSGATDEGGSIQSWADNAASLQDELSGQHGDALGALVAATGPGAAATPTPGLSAPPAPIRGPVKSPSGSGAAVAVKAGASGTLPISGAASASGRQQAVPTLPIGRAMPPAGTAGSSTALSSTAVPSARPTARVVLVNAKPKGMPVWQILAAASGAAAVLAAILLKVFSHSGTTAPDPAPKKNDPAVVDVTPPTPLPEPMPVLPTPVEIPVTKPSSGPVLQGEFDKLAGAAQSAYQKWDLQGLQQALIDLGEFGRRNANAADPTDRELADRARELAKAALPGSRKDWDPNSPIGKMLGPGLREGFRKHQTDAEGFRILSKGTANPIAFASTTWNFEDGAYVAEHGARGGGPSASLACQFSLPASGFELRFRMKWLSAGGATEGWLQYGGRTEGEKGRDRDGPGYRLNLAPENHSWMPVADKENVVRWQTEIPVRTWIDVRLVVTPARHDVYIQPEGAPKEYHILSTDLVREDAGGRFSFNLSAGKLAVRDIRVKGEKEKGGDERPKRPWGFGPGLKRDKFEKVEKSE